MNARVPFLLLFPSGRFEYEIQIGPYGTVVEQLEILKYDTQFTTQQRNMLALDMQHIISQHLGIARCNIQFADKGFELTSVDREYFNDEVVKLAFMQIVG